MSCVPGLSIRGCSDNTQENAAIDLIYFLQRILPSFCAKSLFKTGKRLGFGLGGMDQGCLVILLIKLKCSFFNSRRLAS